MKSSSQSIDLKGRAVSSGIGIGPTTILSFEPTAVRPDKIEPNEIPSHLQKLRDSRNLLLEEYDALKGESNLQEARDILEAQILTLKDPEVNKRVQFKIESERHSVGYAIFSTLNEYIQLLETSAVKWANDRAIDIVAIRDEWIDVVSENRKEISIEKGDVIFAEEISPALMVKISRIKVAAIVMEKGGDTSHAVILSQSLGIPCVINTHWNRYQVKEDTPVIVDGLDGHVIINPDDQQLAQYEKRREEDFFRVRESLKWVKRENVTKCGSPFSLRANVEFLEELPKVTTHGAQGVGLLRTETVLFETTEFDVKEQIEFYSKILQATANEFVTIRLFDAGGDKLIDDKESEANPFLGWRGVRMLLDQPTLLKKQLEAIYRVSAGYRGRLKILIPMVSRLEEILKLKAIAEEVRGALAGKNVDFDNEIPIGIMVEVPSIVMMANKIANYVDFFSIGTNDLTQYTLAVDRGNEKISTLFDSYHPAIWKMIRMTKEAADAHRIPISVCGEMASKPEAAACLLGMGINDLSMNSSAIPNVKAVLCSHTLLELQELAERVLETDELKGIHELFSKWTVTK
jgi:phosphotransferase system enzyme I (PtsI)